jgi:hypothetical protein
VVSKYQQSQEATCEDEDLAEEHEEAETEYTQ